MPACAAIIWRATACRLRAATFPQGLGGLVAKQDGQSDGMSAPLGGGGSAAGIGSNTAPHLAYHDLRKWLEEAQKLGEVKEVNGLSWQGDIGMVSEMALHDDNAPCFVFGDVPGTIKGSRVLVNFFGGKRKNMTL